MSSPPGGLTSTIADLYTGGDYEKAKRVIRLVRDFDAQGIGASSPEPSSARTTADSPVAVFSDAPNSPSPSQELIRAGDAMRDAMKNKADLSVAFDQPHDTWYHRLVAAWDAARQSSPSQPSTPSN